MNTLFMCVVLMCAGVSSASAGIFNAALDDIKSNTGFAVESAIPYTSVDWNRGSWAAGSAFPFFHVGSYIYVAGALSKDISDSSGRSEMLTGFRLNKLTRPLAVKALDTMTFGNLDKVAFLEYLAKSTSVGATVGHDFSYEEKKKVVFNSYGLFFGFEVMFGDNGNVVSASATSSRRPGVRIR